MCIRDRVSTQSTWGILKGQMRGFLALLLLGAALSNIAVAIDSGELRASLAQLEDNDYAKNVMNILQIQLATGGSVDEIKILLQRMKSELLKQQTREDNAYKVIDANCQNIISSLNIQIPLYEKTAEDATKRKAQSESEIAESERNIQDVTQQLQAAQGRLKSGGDNFENEQKLSNDKIARLQEAIAAIEKAIKLLKSRKGSSKTALTELDSHISKIFSIGSEFTINNLAYYSSEVRSTRALFNNAPSLVEVGDKHTRKLVKLLNELGDLFRNALLQEQKLTAGSAERWEKVKDDLEIEIRTLQDALTHLNARIVKGKSETEETAATIGENNHLVEVSKKSLETNQAECNTQRENNNLSKTNRSSDIEILDKLIEYFNQHGNALQDYLRQRSEQ
eukprot:TRINITY_DN178_c0_g3_i1.p1 TRINITY_DN178_c0_g3~~TRINITY_DN178_c0_g3_i1.p1  ORF type:complete len:394 (+),score=141.01 TRINITY_DN178_c0_g3_i1:92-1273(+)